MRQRSRRRREWFQALSERTHMAEDATVGNVDRKLVYDPERVGLPGHEGEAVGPSLRS